MYKKKKTKANRGSLGMAVTLLLLTLLVLMIFFIIANPTIILDYAKESAVTL